MFVREKKTPLSDKTAVQLVNSVRKNGKVRQKIVRHFGYAFNAEELAALKALALRYKQELEAEKQPVLFATGTLMDTVVKAADSAGSSKPLPVDLLNIIEEKRIKIGIHQVYGSLFDQIGFGRVVANPSRKKASVRLMRDIVMTRIDRPESKHAAVATLAATYGIPADVNSVYRMMDLLDEKAIEKVQKASYQNTFGLLGGKIDVIFYDCTTLYFESFTEDDLKSNGYSKDGKFNQAQVILALLVTAAGLPVGYELFPGNTFEGNTLENALDKLHEKYRIDKVVFVADAAMLSATNLQMLEQRRQPYIVGARIKNTTKAITRQILDKTAYQPLGDSTEQQAMTYRDIPLNKDKDGVSRRLIVSHSPRRAAKDARDREKAIEQVKKRLLKSKDPKALLNNYGYKKFITIQGDAQIGIHQQKIDEAEQWDGLHGVMTNITSEDASQILSHYKGLWQVEETFRISKHNLRMRPIFHWTPRRIRAHIALCYMALSCVRTLEYRVRLQYKKLSPEVIRKSITELEASILKDTTTGKRYCLPAQATQDARKIYQILGLKWRETPYLLK